MNKKGRNNRYNTKKIEYNLIKYKEERYNIKMKIRKTKQQSTKYPLTVNVL